MAGSYYLAGRPGSTIGPPANIPFYDQPGSASPFTLVYADASSSASLPLPFQVDAGSNQLEVNGVGLDVATVSEYFPSGGMATAWGARFRLIAEPGPSNNGLLYAVDLRRAGTPPAAPAKVQVSSDTVSGKFLCSIPPAVFDNYRAADQSWVVFHAKGPDLNCGTLDDQYVGVQISMSSSTASKALAQLEPIEALYDTAGTGTITGYLAINHPTVCTALSGCTTTCGTVQNSVPDGSPVCPVPLQQLDTSFAASKTFPTTLLGNGVDVSGGDFKSLGISTGNIWLYWDSTQIVAVNLTTGAATSLITLASGDAVARRAVFDGTTAYVAVDNTTTGSRILQINLSNSTVAATVTDAAAVAGVTPVGVTSNDLIYLINDGSGIKSISKASPTSATSLITLTPSSQKIDSLMGIGASTAPVAFLVGDTVYFTVADLSASGTTGFAKQAFYFTTTGTATTATAVSSSVSAVLGVVAPSSIPTTGPYANVGALVVTGGVNAGTGVAAFATPSGTQATLSLYSASVMATGLGTISSNATGGTAGPLTNPITGVALGPGPVQVGMPAMLTLVGSAGGSPSEDVAVYTTDGSIPLTEISGFNQ
jgi:hypothetical protein